MADETDPTQYFRAMEEKERALAAQYERDRQHRTETLAELSKCLMDRESEYRRLMLEAQQKERRFVDLLENRAAWEPAGERSALDADKSREEGRRLRHKERALAKKADALRVELQDLQGKWSSAEAQYAGQLSSVHGQYVQLLAQQQQQQQQTEQALLAAQARADALEAQLHQAQVQHAQDHMLQQQELDVLRSRPPPPADPPAPVPTATSQTQTSHAPDVHTVFVEAAGGAVEGALACAAAPASAPAPVPEPGPELFEAKNEYEEDLGPTLESRMFSRAFVVVFVLSFGALCSRPTMKEMLAAACVRRAIGTAAEDGIMLEAGELPVLAQCAVAYPTSDPTAMARSLAECLPEPSAVVTRLRLCARFQEYNFAHFWALLPFVFCWVPLLALGLLVVRHDMRLLQSRRAFVPQYWIALLLPWLLTATLYYIAQPLSNLVLMFRAYGAGMPATEVWTAVLPRLGSISLFWCFLMELISKLCYSNTSFSLFYLNPLYFTYPKVPVNAQHCDLPVLDPQQYENNNPRTRASVWVTVSMSAVCVAVVVVVSLYLPIDFLEAF